jgi:hypothetical protein
MPVTAAPSDLDAYLSRALAGEDTAWARLLGLLWERVDARVAMSRRMGQLRGSLDDRREVVSRVFARLRRNDLRALRTFAPWQARNPDKTLDDWLAIVTANVIRDYVTERLGDVDAAGNGLKRLIHTLADAIEEDSEPRKRPAITTMIAARELLELARARLPADQLGALAAWLDGHACERPKVRAALARLRRELRS